MEPSRGKSICVPFDSEEHYAACVTDLESFLRHLTEVFAKHPELFPAGISEGFVLHDKSWSIKQQVMLRRIALGVALKLTHPPGPLGGLLSQGQFLQVTVLTHLNDSDAEVRSEKRPSGSPSVALLETANSEDGLLAVSPAHAGAFQPLGRERLARCFDHPTTNGQPSRMITGIVHALPLVLEVREFGVEQFATLLVLLATHLA